MKLAVIGATGWIGSHITSEAITRGHQVNVLVRDASKVTQDNVTVTEFDLTKDDIASAAAGSDVVIAAIGGRALGNHEIVANTAKQLLNALAGTGTRILWVGGAGSLEVAPGVTLVSSPDFPAEYKAEAIAQGEALDVFRVSTTDTPWTFVSPAAVIYPGESEGPYRVGGDSFFTDANGESKISVTDYAKAMLDEAQSAAHLNQRISIAY
ncbi:NAD(P)-dependent oxidoreductase [Pseudoalteromonas sp. N1230-9]|uniref:NAD(P)-dependent oxidoreductase n=1 Tax=Pseudoalteromonas sp. N1230-9 TaxID=2907156 RepID=UPI002B30230D|nr:NAD(P)-dependent oxidoreductase [Pseudoalteromonas sp. N1230-9]